MDLNLVVVFCCGKMWETHKSFPNEVWKACLSTQVAFFHNGPLKFLTQMKHQIYGLRGRVIPPYRFFPSERTTGKKDYLSLPEKPAMGKQPPQGHKGLRERLLVFQREKTKYFPLKYVLRENLLVLLTPKGG